MTEIPPTAAFDPEALFRADLPPPAEAWAGRAPFAFDNGDNDPSSVPVEELAALAAEVIRREGRRLAYYHLGGSPLGYEPLRAFLAGHLGAMRGMRVDQDQILVTSGSTQGLDLVNGLLLAPGDTVLVEAHTYSAALNRLHRRDVRLEPIPLDEQGLDIDALEATLRRLHADGVAPKYLYTIPTIQNPTGTILPMARRLRLLSLAHEYGFLVFEDECYAELTWEAQAPASLFALDPETVIHIGSLSKTLAPALRVGYLTAAPAALNQILALKRDGGAGALNQMVAAEYLTHHHGDHLARLRGTLKAKCDHMIEAIGREFGVTADVRPPDGGMFVWVQFDPAIDVRTLAEHVRAAGVSVNVGADWSVDADRAGNLMRLCFASPSMQEIDSGIARLALVSRQLFGRPLHSNNQNHA